MREYPDNQPGKYKVNLSHKHDLHDGVWEIGLNEIQFTNNWRHTTPDFSLVAWVGHYSHHVPERYKLRPSGYQMSEMEERLLDVSNEVSWSFDQLITAYVSMPAGKWLHEYAFGDALAKRIR
jgi:hypothetical protein